MYITDILNNLPKQNGNSLSAKITKNTEARKIRVRLENYISQILDYLGEENDFITKGLSYNYGSKISDEDKKELLDLLVSEVKMFPDKLKTEINKFFSDINTVEKEDKEEANVTVTAVKALEPKEGSVFGY